VSFSPCECVACCKANEDEFEIHEDINANPRIKGDKVRNPIDPCGCEQVATEFCETSGGETCAENGCPGCRGPCCNEFQFGCVSSTEDDCDGVFFGCCEPEPQCLGGCCDTRNGTCELTTEDACEELTPQRVTWSSVSGPIARRGYTFLGCGVSCDDCTEDPVPCTGGCITYTYDDDDPEAPPVVTCEDGVAEYDCGSGGAGEWLGCNSTCESGCTGVCWDCGEEPTCTPWVTEAACDEAEGTWIDCLTTCETSECPPPCTGACWLCNAETGEGVCSIETEEECTRIGGAYWLGCDTECSEVEIPCQPCIGGCTHYSEELEETICLDLTLEECSALPSNIWQGCDNFCE
jgi:hypothetical protein